MANAEPQSEAEALAALSHATHNNTLRKVIQKYSGEKFSAPEMQSALRMMVSPYGMETAAIHHLQRVATDPSLKRLLSLFAKRSGYFEDLMATQANATWLNDPEFIQAYNAGASISAWGHGVRWRVYTLLICATHSKGLQGDFVECGVDRGGTAMCVISYIKPDSFKDRKFYLFDTFEGLVQEQLTEEERVLARAGLDRYPPVLKDVEKTFAKHDDFVRIVPGAVPETLSAFGGGPVAYLHIDMNVAYPERAAFEFFWPYLVQGAPVIFDDYGFPFHLKQKEALDEAAKLLGREIMMLPTGQGLIWK